MKASVGNALLLTNAMTRKKRLSRIAVILLVMVALAAVVLCGAKDPGGKEIARYRNALLAEAGTEADFNWRPADVPADYLQERAPIPDALSHWDGLPRTGDTLSRALATARALSVKPRFGGPIQRSVVVTLAIIETTGTGYCVDYTSVFGAIAYTMGIPVREWAFSFDGFGGRGHVFNELWDADNQRWFMLDVFHGFYPRDSESGTPLSALEFRRRVLSAPASIRWERLTPSVFAFKSDAEALDYYRRGAREWYLWWGNNYLGYDQKPLVSWASQFGRLPEQVAAMLTGVLPKFKVLLTEQNRSAFERLMRLKYMLITAAAMEIFLSFVFVWQLFLLRKESALRQRRAATESTSPGKTRHGILVRLAKAGIFRSFRSTLHRNFARNVVFPLQERIKGKNTHAILRELEQSQWLPANRVHELQFDRLKSHLEFAYQHVPYYRHVFDEHGIQPDRIRDFTDFQRIPFLTRESLRHHFENLRATAPIRGLQKLSTGGSTGVPVTVLVDPIRNSFIDAARLRSHRWFDADIGVREVVLWGSPIEITRQDRIRCVRDRLLNSRLLSAFNMGETSLASYSDFIASYQPVKIYGYASALYLLARYFREAKRRPPRSLKVIFATAEPLFDFQRQTIEEVFGVKVAVEYGARDAGLMANECPNGGLHIPAEGMVVEIERYDSDTTGEIVVTNLYSRAMPIIRYRTGDVGTLGSEPCSCGRGLPLVKKVEGRQTDFITTSDGRVIHALAVIYVLRECPEIEKFQVVQESIDKLTATIVPRANLESAVRKKIGHDLQRVLGSSMEINIVTAQEIAATASGKYRYVVSKVAASPQS